jgi:hypothetical protein
VREWGEESPAEFDSLAEEEEEGGSKSASPVSSMRSPSLVLCHRRPKRTQTGTGPSASSPQKPCLMPVSFDLKGMSILPVLKELTHLSGILQVSSSSMIAAAATAVMVGSSSSSPRGRNPYSRGPILGPSYRCPQGMRVELPIPHAVLLLLSSFLNSKCDFWMTGVVPRLL